MVKVIALILAAIIVLTVGYVVVKGVINMFNGYDFLEAFGSASRDITTLWGLIKQKTETTVKEFPMANRNITWSTARSW